MPESDPQTRQCTDACRRVLSLTHEFFYPLKRGGHSTACKECQRARKRRNTVKARGRYSEGLDSTDFQGVMQLRDTLRDAEMKGNFQGNAERRFREQFQSLMRKFQPLCGKRRVAAVMSVCSVLMIEMAELREKEVAHTRHLAREKRGAVIS